MLSPRQKHKWAVELFAAYLDARSFERVCHRDRAGQAQPRIVDGLEISDWHITVQHGDGQRIEGRQRSALDGLLIGMDWRCFDAPDDSVEGNR